VFIVAPVIFTNALCVGRCLFAYPSLLSIFFERLVLALCINDSNALELMFIISATSAGDFCSILGIIKAVF